MDNRRARSVLDPDAGGIEDNDFLVAFASRLCAGENVAEFSVDVVSTNRPRRDRRAEVADGEALRRRIRDDVSSSIAWSP
jgi:hypothetical protein